MSIAELQHITKTYHSSAGIPNHVLHEVSISIPGNKAIAITGPSGSGKSTLLNILGTLDKPTSGNVLINGEDTLLMDQPRLSQIRNRFIGFVFQQHFLLPQLNVIENVLLPILPVQDKLLREESAERAVLLLDRVGMKEAVNKFPAQLSVGECQRTAVVRALINQPGLLLADEPTASLDAGNAVILAELLAELQNNYQFSMVIVTHDQEVAKRMKIHYRLANGTIELNSDNL